MCKKKHPSVVNVKITECLAIYAFPVAHCQQGGSTYEHHLGSSEKKPVSARFSRLEKKGEGREYARSWHSAKEDEKQKEKCSEARGFRIAPSPPWKNSQASNSKRVSQNGTSSKVTGGIRQTAK